MFVAKKNREVCLRPKLDLERRASITFRLGFDEKHSAASVRAD